MPYDKLGKDNKIMGYLDLLPSEEQTMILQTEAINEQASRVVLSGKLDIVGAETVSVPLATLSNSNRGLIIDMSAVTFLASIGIRHLVSAARTLSRRNGRLVLLKPTQMVVEVLKTSGLTDILPIVMTDEEALAVIMN
jgi:anti-anti-sigma factor